MTRFDETLASLIERTAKSHWLALLLITLLALALTLPGQSSMPVTDRDEARFVQASKQMLETGDYIDIRNQENPRWKKPVGIYWLQSLSAQITGYQAEAPIWVYRVPSALGIIAAALLTYWAFLPLFSRPAALIAGLVMASTVTTGIEANIAKTDAVLLATVVLAQGALIRLYLPLEPITRFGRDHWLLWLGIGAGFLVKGPIVLIPVISTLVWISIFDQAWYIWRAIRPGRGLLIFAAIAAPWYIAIAIQSGGAFFAESLGKDLLGKVGNAAEKHWGPPGYYLATIWVSFWPWTPLALLAVPLAWAERSTPQMKFLAGWIIPHWLLFALLSTKLPHYVLPVLPAIAGLVGYWLTSQSTAAGPKLRGTAVILFLLGSLGAGLFAFVPRPYFDGEFAFSLFALFVVVLTLICLAARALSQNAPYSFAAFGTAALLFLLPTLTVVTAPETDGLFLSPRMAEAHARYDGCADRPLVSTGYHEMSVVFLSGTDTQLTDLGTAAARLKDPDGGWRVFVQTPQGGDPQELPEFSGLPLKILTTISGTNYNSGDEIDLHLVARADDQVLAACIK